MLIVLLYTCVLFMANTSPGLQQGSLRLVGSTSTYFYAGRLEIYVSGQWGTVCDDGWGNNEAIVACGQMGFEGAYASDWTLSSSGSSSQTIWLDDVTCTGSESQLINCNHRGLGVENCGHSEDIGIRCTRLVTSTLPPESVTISTSTTSTPVTSTTSSRTTSSHTTSSVTGIISGVVIAVVFLCVVPCVIICIVVVICVQQKKRTTRVVRAPVTTAAGTTVAVAMVNQQQPQQQQVVYQPQPNYHQQQGGYPPQPDYQQQQGWYPPQPDYQQQQGGYPPQPDYQQQQGGYPPQPDYKQKVGYPGQQPAPVPSYPQATDPNEDNPPPYPY